MECTEIIPRDRVSTFKHGVNFINTVKGRFIIFMDEFDKLSVCENVCRHNGGNFVQDIEDIGSSKVTCTFHGWKLDCQTLKYVNPPDCLDQQKLLSELDDFGNLILTQFAKPNPWDTDPQLLQILSPNELVITYLSHACIEVRMGNICNS